MTSGLCGSPSQCPGGALPYGMPGYGYRASYETQGADGGRIGSSGVFVTSSCCGALQLPFITFGFGDFATYIENVLVSVPAPSGVSLIFAYVIVTVFLALYVDNQVYGWPLSNRLPVPIFEIPTYARERSNTRKRYRSYIFVVF